MPEARLQRTREAYWRTSSTFINHEWMTRAELERREQNPWDFTPEIKQLEETLEAMRLAEPGYGAGV